MNPKLIKDLNIRSEIIQLLEENIVETLHDIGFDSYFLDMIPKPRWQKQK